MRRRPPGLRGVLAGTVTYCGARAGGLYGLPGPGCMRAAAGMAVPHGASLHSDFVTVWSTSDGILVRTVARSVHFGGRCVVRAVHAVQMVTR